MSAMMKANLLAKIGGPEGFKVSDQVPCPVASKGYVLVKNIVASVNYVDVYFRQGHYPSAKTSDLILGQEAAGIIEDLPEDAPSDLKIGDRVVWLWQGGYAQYTAVPFSQITKIPASVSDEDAAGVFLTGITALALTTDAHPVQSGETVLVHAAAGGLGLLLCQLLRDRGATVIGTAGGPEKCKLALKFGASHVIDYRKDHEWATKVHESTDGKGVDVVYDGVGKDTCDGSFAAVKAFGKIVFIGNASGPISRIPVEKLAVKNISVMRPALKNYITAGDRMARYGKEALDRVASGQWVVQKHDRLYSLEDVEQAHRDLENRVTVGKLLIKI
ncbi:Polyketide synthase enoylreductase [Penicillium coprophilum]|uniref:Polyketide synthase enoylreductase n=1 Tax=Penicillium coprophilum TaxID=36646 RepID=UPI002388BA80|nr:Polyketide synthase enoylreductase [Penicillium coprophilum]KAJ5178282.1 Polyketide synthase enoylreductase [Penicillium coprophilum]